MGRNAAQVGETSFQDGADYCRAWNEQGRLTEPVRGLRTIRCKQALDSFRLPVDQTVSRGPSIACDTDRSEVRGVRDSRLFVFEVTPITQNGGSRLETRSS